MSQTNLPSSIHLGFLSIFQEASGFFGGYLVTNSWGRPLEYRVSTAVQPNRVQQVLYGPTLTEYIVNDVIGKTLIDKCSVPVHLVVVDTLSALALRSRVEVAVVAVVPPEAAQKASGGEWISLAHARSSLPLAYSARFAADADYLAAVLERVDPALDLSEPFGRIREATNEARKMGVMSRAVAVA